MAVVGLTIGIGADTKKFNQSIKKMDKSIRQTNQEVYNLSKSLQMEFDAGKFTRAQKLAQDSLKQTEIKAQALRDRLQYLDEVSMDKSSEEYKKLQRDLTRAELNAQQLAVKLQQIKDIKIEELAKKFEKVGDGITKAGQAMVPFSAAAGAILAAFAKIGTSAIAAGDDIGTTAQQLNISTDALQRWRYIAEQTDVPITQLENGFKKIQAGLGSLAAGETTDPIAMALEAMGVSAEQASLGMSENFEDIIDKLAGMEDATMQAYYANEIFGARMGAQLIPMLNDGGEGLAALSAEFENFNYLTEQQVQELDAYEDTWQKMQYTFKTIKDQIGYALLPTFQVLVDFLTNKVAPTVQKMSEWFTSLSQKQIETGIAVLGFVAALAPLLLITGKVTKGIGGVVRMVGSLNKALMFLAAHPIILVIAIIVGLMALLYTKNEEFKASIDGLIQTLGQTLMPILNLLGSVFKMLMDALMPVMNALMNALTPILIVVVDVIAMLLGVLAPLINMMVNNLMPVIWLISKAFEGIAWVLEKLLVPYLRFVGKVWGEVFGMVPKILEGVITAVEWMINKVIDLFNGLIEKVNKIGKYIGVELGKFDKVEIDVNFDVAEVPEIDDSTITVDKTTQPSQAAQTVIETGVAGTINTGPVTNIDSSSKDFEINVTVQNYGTEVDVEDLVKQFNLELAKQM